MESVLLIYGLEKGREGLAREIQKNGWSCTAVPGGPEALRLIAEEDFALVVLDGSQADAPGQSLLQTLLEDTASLILLLVREEPEPDKIRWLEKNGVLVLPKPMTKAMFCQAIRFALAARRRMLGLKTENAKLHRKIVEIRLVDRAKCVLIQYLGLTEPQAHRYIEKQAMDRRVTREEVASGILKTYET